MDFGSAHKEGIRHVAGDGGYPRGEAKDNFSDHAFFNERPPGGKDLTTQLDHASPSQVDRAMTLMDQKVAKAQQSDTTKFQMVSEQTQRLVEGLQSIAVSREILDERKTKELRMIENSIALDLNGVRQARKDGELKAEKAGETYMAELR